PPEAETPRRDRSEETPPTRNTGAGNAAPNATTVEPVTSAAPPPTDAVALAELKPAHWPQVFRALPLTGVTRSMAGNAILSDVTGNRLALMLDEQQATLFNDEHRQRIATALGNYFGVAIELRMEPGVVEAETPAR